ncbi:hypothetical protein C8R45DRAFT_1115017 [Mycena sanguinolenta]|nr:hypothetical protein C8R45DRAFT_1115017 [Mycena sanguinolenta]
MLSVLSRANVFSPSDLDTIRSCSVLRYDSDGDAAQRRRRDAIPLPLAIQLCLSIRAKEEQTILMLGKVRLRVGRMDEGCAWAAGVVCVVSWRWGCFINRRMYVYTSPRRQRSSKSTPAASTSTTTTLPMPVPTLPSRANDLSHRASLHDTLSLSSYARLRCAPDRPEVERRVGTGGSALPFLNRNFDLYSSLILRQGRHSIQKDGEGLGRGAEEERHKRATCHPKARARSPARHHTYHSLCPSPFIYTGLFHTGTSIGLDDFAYVVDKSNKSLEY